MNVIKKLTGYKQSLYKPEMRPKAVLFDVNGTIFPATAAAPALRELGLDENLVPVRQQTKAFVHA
jgi:FMN phosphatase YigB (HAD superfamily)